MADHEDEHDFVLERLDQQIEQPVDFLDRNASDLVTDLQRMYSSRRHENPASAESLQRVQRLLMNRLQQADSERILIPPAGLQKRRGWRRTTQEKTREHRPGRLRFSRLFGSIAAVLAVAFCVGSMVVLLQARTTGPHGSVQPTISSLSPQGAKPDCFPVFDFDRDATHKAPDRGEQAVCQQGQEMLLHDTTIIGDHTLTLISAYADSNRAIVKFAVNGHFSLKDEVLMNSLVLSDGTQLFLGGPANSFYYDPIHNRTLQMVSFDTRQVPAGATSLQATAEFIATSHTGGLVNSLIRFTLPFYATKQVITPNQAVTISGQLVTLTQVVITASQTVLRLVPAQQLSPSSSIALNATLNGDSKLLVAETTEGSGGEIGWTIFVQEPLSGKSGMWTLHLVLTGDSLATGSGKIQFTVPHAG